LYCTVYYCTTNTAYHCHNAVIIFLLVVDFSRQMYKMSSVEWILGCIAADLNLIVLNFELSESVFIHKTNV